MHLKIFQTPEFNTGVNDVLSIKVEYYDDTSTLQVNYTMTIKTVTWYYNRERPDVHKSLSRFSQEFKACSMNLRGPDSKLSSAL